ncbi:MAG TPA: nucleotidyltransferase domain-containing protein [Caldithrix sp.]|nr:nucleotidyltransferase domain-containing protein [Caldithrix sp.]
MNDVWVKKFIRESLPQVIKKFKPDKIILFGSRATGEARQESDIDIIIVSSAFANIPFLKRMPMVLRNIKFDKHIDFICYSPQEFQRMKKKSSIVMEALEQGQFLVS